MIGRRAKDYRNRAHVSLYDRMVGWEQVMALELPFYLGLLREGSVHDVLDAACGTGRHCIALANAGFHVVGSDISAPMLRVARESISQAGVRVRLVRSAWANLEHNVTELFDAVLCPGNALPDAQAEADIWRAVLGMSSRARPGGRVVIDIRNFSWIDMTRSGHGLVPLGSVHLPGGDVEQWWWQVEQQGERYLFEVVREVAGNRQTMGFGQSQRPVPIDHLLDLVCKSGADDIRVYADYRLTPATPAEQRTAEFLQVAWRRRSTTSVKP